MVQAKLKVGNDEISYTLKHVQILCYFNVKFCSCYDSSIIFFIGVTKTEQRIPAISILTGKILLADHHANIDNDDYQ